MNQDLVAWVRDGLFGRTCSRWIIRCLPYRVAHVLTRFVGLAIYLADPGGRAETLANLRAALGDRHSEDDLRRLTRLTYSHCLVPFLDLLFLSHASAGRLRRFLARRFELENHLALEQACQKGRGAIVCAPHFGSFLLGGLALAFRLDGAVPIYLFADRPDRALHPSQAYAPLSKKLNIHVIYNDGLAIRSAVRVLRTGGILVILPDMFQINEGLMFAPLFGMLSATMGGAAFLAQKTGAPILFAGAFPEGLRFRVVVEPPLRWRPTGDVSKDVYLVSLLINHEMERLIRLRPELWSYWISFHQRAFGRQPVPNQLTWDGCRALVAGLRNRLPGSSRDTRALADLALAAMERSVGDAPGASGLGAAIDAFTESCNRLVPLGNAPCPGVDSVNERR